MYDVAERLLLRRVQISHNRSLDGVLDSLNSRHITDAGPVGLIDDQASDDELLLPPSAAGACPALRPFPPVHTWFVLGAGAHPTSPARTRTLRVGDIRYESSP